MPLTTCWSIVKLLKSLKLNPSVKWPNDILLNKKKVSGILCESFSNTFEKDNIKY